MSQVIDFLVKLPQGVQDRLAFIATDPLPWKELVLAFSTAIWAFELFLTYVFS
jgi:hypothetical protein